MKHTALLLPIALFLAPVAVATAAEKVSRPINSAGRRAVVKELGKRLEEQSVHPEVARRVATRLRKKEALGGYDNATDTVTFAQALSDDLHVLGNDLDRQARLLPTPPLEPETTAQESVPSASPP